MRQSGGSALPSCRCSDTSTSITPAGRCAPAGGMSISVAGTTPPACGLLRGRRVRCGEQHVGPGDREPDRRSTGGSQEVSAAPSPIGPRRRLLGWRAAPSDGAQRAGAPRGGRRDRRTAGPGRDARRRVTADAGGGCTGPPRGPHHRLRPHEGRRPAPGPHRSQLSAGPRRTRALCPHAGEPSGACPAPSTQPAEVGESERAL